MFQLKVIAAAGILAILATSGTAHAASDEHRQLVGRMLAEGKQYVGQEFVVQFKADAPQAERNAVLSRVGAKSATMLFSRPGVAATPAGAQLVRGSGDMRAMMDALNADSRVEFAEPNWVYHSQAVPSDPYTKAGMQWNMYGASTSPASYYGTGALTAWNAGHTCGNSPVYVGVVDEGILVSHPDLKNNIWVNPLEKADGKDNDLNGYADDVNGYNFVNNTGNVSPAASEQHGTHVAGIIGAVGNNAVGVAGLCWNVKIIPAKFMDASGGTLANAIRAIDYLTNLKLKQKIRLVAINNSWGGGGYSLALQQAIERANAADILFVAAAGNGGADSIGDNNDVVASYPGNYKVANVISVAAIDATGSRTKFSNYGATTVHLAAPGANILSTIPTTSGPGYGYMSGTSMAAPHVTAAAAMYAATHPTAKAADIKAAILGHVRKTGSLTGLTITGGTLDVSTF
jgi:subtilisin family serine protease